MLTLGVALTVERGGVEEGYASGLRPSPLARAEGADVLVPMPGRS